MGFNIGDRVWVELQVIDASDDMMQVISDPNKQPYQTAVLGWAHASDLRSSAGPDIKQAIREALLSDEFLAAFAVAWVKTPILHESELNLIVADETRPYKSWNEIANEEFQPVATAEVSLDATLEPITGSESEAYYLNKLKNGESK